MKKIKYQIKNKRILLIALVVLLGLALIFTIRFIFGGPEDTWICKNNQWIKHGNPNSPKPETTCDSLGPKGNRVEDSTTQESELHSIDGTMTLIMRTNSKGNESRTYSFFVADIKDKNKENERLLFTKTVDAKEEIILPHNSWSPDKKYLFLKEKDKNGKLNFFILKVSGENFADGEQYLNVGDLFTQKKIAYKLDDATGWASPIFLNVTTITDDGKKGPSYWFDISSHNFWGHQ